MEEQDFTLNGNSVPSGCEENGSDREEMALVPSLAEKEIKALEKMDSLMTVDGESEAVRESRIESPIESVENSLSKFVSDSFNVTRKDYEFHGKIQDEILTRLNKMSEAQLISLFTTDGVNLNDRTSKLIAPTFQLMTAKQQAEIQARAQERIAATQQGGAVVDGSAGVSGAEMKALNQSMNKDVLQGMAQLTMLLGRVVPKDESSGE